MSEARGPDRAKLTARAAQASIAVARRYQRGVEQQIASIMEPIGLDRDHPLAGNDESRILK